MQHIIDILQERIKPEGILTNEPMRNHTTFKIGGPTDVLVIPESIESVIFAIQACKNESIPFFIMGNGSNLLVRDKGYRGVIIKIAGNIKDSHILEDYIIEADSGISLAALSNKAMEIGYTGMEFASGIPGTLGGAVYMNAGAYDGDMNSIFLSARVLTRDGCVKVIGREEMDFGYRSSRAKREDWVILSTALQLTKGDPKVIKEKMNTLNNKRKENQPLDKHSAGSTFKRPEGYFTGKLIMDSGLKGYSIGDAQVSEKHCGFIVNNGDATAKDVLDLISHIQSVVKHHFNVDLETEICVL